MDLKKIFLNLLFKASTDLPSDVEEALKKAFAKESDNSPAKGALTTILKNIEMARKDGTPMCQDTGSVLFYIDLPENDSEKKYTDAINEALKTATEKQYLRPNAVDSVTGTNSGNNTGINVPQIHFHRWDKDEVKIKLMLKGGGSENVGIQYKLPDAKLKAGRDLDGVRKLIIDAVYQAQGLGCAPGIIGVGIGGDRVSSFALSKVQFFRKIGQRHPEKALAHLEEKVLNELNQLGIGPMGFGGETTALDLFVDYQHRHPASFFVSISYTCWAFRRKSVTLKNGEVYYD